MNANAAGEWPQKGTKGSRPGVKPHGGHAAIHGVKVKISHCLLFPRRVKHSGAGQSESDSISLRLLCLFVAA